MIAFSTFAAVTDRHPVQHRLPWHKLARLLVRHTERPAKGGPLWSPASYPEGATRPRQRRRVSCLVADIDHKVAQIPSALYQMRSKTCAILYTPATAITPTTSRFV